MMKAKLMPRVVFGMIALLVYSEPGVSKTWSLENTPKQYRPGFCESFRRQIIYDRTTQTYKWAMKRKAEGTMNRDSIARLAFSADLVDSMRRLQCPKIP